MFTIQCALESLELGKSFEYLERYHQSLKKVSGAIQSQKVHEKSEKSQKFRMLNLNVKSKCCEKWGGGCLKS